MPSNKTLSIYTRLYQTMDNNLIPVILEAVRRFLSKNRVKIIFGTPCFGGLLHNGFFQSMIETTVNFTRLGIPFEIMTIGNESLIQRARNGIVAKFMADENATHLMFIDADITFSWISLVKLLLGNKELSGGCYPKKCFNWDKIKHQIGKNANQTDDELMARSLDYVFNPIYHQEGQNVVIRVENGMAQVKDIGTGFMMIQKSVIRKMMAKYPETKYKNNVAGYGHGNAGEYFYSLFDCCIDPHSRVYLSEDYLFCKRWLDIGGELWLDINTNLNHTGLIDYKGCLSLIIGEVDVLNKDAQILRAQQAGNQSGNQSGTQNAGGNGNSNNSSSSGNDSKKKKKKNKKKNKLVQNQPGSGSIPDNTVNSGVVHADEGSDSGDESGDDSVVSDNKITEQVANGNHC